MSKGYHFSPKAGRVLRCMNIENCPYKKDDSKENKRVAEGTPYADEDISKKPKVFKTEKEAYKVFKKVKPSSSGNNETIGVSTELAIADAFGISTDDKYRGRGNDEIVGSIVSPIEDFFEKHSLPTPDTYTGKGQNPVDFKDSNNGATFSIKSNKGTAGKQAPQEIGQPSAKTHFEKLGHLYDEDDPGTTAGRKSLFKKEVIKSPTKFLSEYWKFTFDCDYLISVSEVSDNSPKIVAFPKQGSPTWDEDKISFTNDFTKESTTIKYDGVSIGEFQTHTNRDNLKFRWNLAGLIKLKEEGKLPVKMLE